MTIIKFILVFFLLFYIILTCVEKYWVIFVGVWNQSEFFTLKLMGILFSIYDFSPYE
jgi:hypothetical protein